MKNCILFFLFSLSFQSFGQDLSQNLRIQGAQKSEESLKAAEGHLGRSFLPKLRLAFGEEHFKVETVPQKTEPYGFLEARINLFRGGKDALRSEVMKLRSGLGALKSNLSSREELFKVRKLQFEIIFNNELIVLLEKERAANEKIKLQASRRAASGISTRSDILEFAIYDSKLEESIESLKHENKILKIGLGPLLGIPTENLTFPQTLNHDHDEALFTRAVSFEKHPQILSLKHQSEILDRERSIDRRFWLPSLDLYAGHYYNYHMINKDFRDFERLSAQGVGVRLTFELFDGLQSTVKATQKAYQAESKRILAQHAEKNTGAKFEMLKEDLLHTHEVMHYVIDRIQKSDDYLKLTLKEYDRGVKNSLDALTAMQRFYGYERDYLEKKKEYQLIKAELAMMLGE